MTATSDPQQKYGTLLTSAGKRIIANAVATNTPVDIKFIALGDGAGGEYYPSEEQDQLRNQVYQTDAVLVYVDTQNPNYVVVETVLPPDVGGWYIREACIKTEDETVIAIGNYPESYKPNLSQGSAIMGAFKFILEVTNTSNVTLKVDPSLVFVTKEYVDNSINNHVQQTNVHGGTYEKTPRRLMLRNEDGRCQVEAPVHPFDAINKEYMEDYVEEYVKENTVSSQRVLRPEIINPTDGATGIPLACEVTATELALYEGEPEPESSQYRALGPGGVLVDDSGVIPYTTTWTLQLPNVSTMYDLDVRHFDKFGLWSDRSPIVTVTTAATGILPSDPLSPITNSLNEEIVNLALVTAPIHVLGTTAEPVASQFRYSKNHDMSGATDTGEIAYTESFNTVLLEAGTQYYWQARHKDANLGWSPYSQLATFKTKPSTPPDITGMVTTMPKLMLKGTQKSFAISGGISTDGGDVTYSLENITGGFSFSKYEGIAEGETIYVYVPMLDTESYRRCTVDIIAKSSFGATSQPLAHETNVLSQTQWVIQSSQVWAALPFLAQYDVELGAGGSNGGSIFAQSYRSDVSISGGGGGYARKRLTLAANQVLNVVVGRGAQSVKPAVEYRIAPINGGDTYIMGFETTFIAKGGYFDSTQSKCFGGGGIGDVVNKGGDGRTGTNATTESRGCNGGGGGAGGMGNGAIGQTIVASYSNTAQGGQGGGASALGAGITGKDGELSRYAFGGGNQIAYGGKAGVAGGGAGFTLLASNTDEGGINIYGSGGDGSAIITVVLE